MRLRPHRQVLRARTLRADPRYHGGGQGDRRRLSAGRVPRDRRGGQGHGVRHPRLDLWRQPAGDGGGRGGARSEEHTSELQSLMRISYAVFCLKKKTISNKSKIKENYKC